MSCVSCALGGHVSSDTTACDGCGLPHCLDCLTRDESGSWCEECNAGNLRESVEAVGGERLMRVLAGLEGERREYEREGML